MIRGDLRRLGTSMASPRPQDPRAADRARSRVAVLLLAVPLVLGLLIRVEGASASLFGVEGPACVLGEVGGPGACPGCGLTRATALTLHGDVAAAAALNWAGVALVLACALGLALHLDILFRAGRRTPTHHRLLSLGARAFALAVAAAWFTRLLA